MDTGVMTAEGATQEITEVGALESARIIVEVHKSPQTLRPKKDKQAMIPVHVPP